jgi:hypothetical protein
MPFFSRTLSFAPLSFARITSPATQVDPIVDCAAG